MAVTLSVAGGVAAVAATASADRELRTGANWKSRINLRSLSRPNSYARIEVASRNTSVIRAAGDGVDAGVETKNEADVLPSGEWPENYSVLNFQDLIAHYEPVLFKKEAQPESFLGDVMSKKIYTAFPEQKLTEVDHHFDEISGLPVVNKDLQCIGVLSRKDRSKATNGENTTVSEVMSTPPITLSADKTVSDAAVLMLKNKVHRIPVVNSASQVVGIVTRTDIFNALEGGPLEGK